MLKEGKLIGDNQSTETIRITTFRHRSWLIGLAGTEKGLARISFPARSKRSFRAEIERRFHDARIVESNAALRDARRQITEYLNGKRRDFKLTLDLRVTPFQKRVLEAACAVPYGETASYGEIGRRIGTRGARAVGGALNKNPLPLCIPCHRVIGANGSLVGFGGTGGLKLKRYLLELERG